MQIIKKIFYCVACTIILNGCQNAMGNWRSFNLRKANDLPEILKKRKITVLTENSLSSFFVYKGNKLGFEYELLQAFANELGINLEVKVISNIDQIENLLNNNVGDIIACNYTVCRSKRKQINYSTPYLKTPLVLIQRKSNDKNISNLTYLAQQKVHVRKQSNAYRRLLHLQEEIADSIKIIAEKGSIHNEDLIEMVAEGIIDYAVTEKNVAKVNQYFHQNINIETVVSSDQKIAFGLRKSSPILQEKFNSWLINYMKTKAFEHLKNKYFSLKTYASIEQKYLSSIKGIHISNFDDLFKDAVKDKKEIDWRLLASIAYQESKFNPNVIGYGGSFGLMQFMPRTGRVYGVYPYSSARKQIHGASMKLKHDLNKWKNIQDKNQREKFTIATYNAGIAHIQDAQRLAKKYGLKPHVWDNNVELMLLNLSKEKYYTDKLVKFGAWKGGRTYKYVKSVHARYIGWKTIYQ